MLKISTHIQTLIGATCVAILLTACGGGSSGSSDAKQDIGNLDAELIGKWRSACSETINDQSKTIGSDYDIVEVKPNSNNTGYDVFYEVRYFDSTSCAPTALVATEKSKKNYLFLKPTGTKTLSDGKVVKKVASEQFALTTNEIEYSGSGVTSTNGQYTLTTSIGTDNLNSRAPEASKSVDIYYIQNNKLYDSDEDTSGNVYPSTLDMNNPLTRVQ